MNAQTGKPLELDDFGMSEKQMTNFAAASRTAFSTPDHLPTASFPNEKVTPVAGSAPPSNHIPKQAPISLGGGGDTGTGLSSVPSRKSASGTSKPRAEQKAIFAKIHGKK